MFETGTTYEKSLAFLKTNALFDQLKSIFFESLQEILKNAFPCNMDPTKREASIQHLLYDVANGFVNPFPKNCCSIKECFKMKIKHQLLNSIANEDLRSQLEKNVEHGIDVLFSPSSSFSSTSSTPAEKGEWEYLEDF